MQVSTKLTLLILFFIVHQSFSQENRDDNFYISKNIEATDVVVNAKNSIIGPKINAFMYYQFIVIGSELATYTDFKQLTFRYIPIIGIGGEKFKVTFNPHVILSNKKFQSINKGSIQLTVNFPLDRKPRAISQ